MMLRTPLYSLRSPLVGLAVVAALLATGFQPGAPVHAEELGPDDAGSRMVEFDLPNTSSLPTDIVAGADGTVWVSLFGERNVLHLDRNGVLLATVPVSGPVTKMTTDHEGGVWGVQLTANYVVHLTVDHRALERRIPTPNSFPADIWDGGDQVYFTESGTGQLGRLTESTWGVDEWPLPAGVSPEALDGNDGFVAAADADGTVWFFDRDGAPQHECLNPGATDIQIEDVVFGQIAVTALVNGQVDWFTCDLATGRVGGGHVVQDLGRAKAFVTELDRTWFVDAETNSLGRLDAGGARSQYLLPSGRKDAVGLAQTEGRYLWTIEKTAGKLVRFDSVATIGIERLAGADRYETAVEVAGNNTRGVAFVVSGEKFADALSAGPIAAGLTAPLLLTTRDALPSATEAWLREHNPSSVVIVGGEASVSSAVAAQIAAAAPAATVKRVGGADRYAVSRALLDGSIPLSARQLYVADGRNFPDALSATPAAARRETGILLVDGGAALNAEQLAVVSRFAGAGRIVRIAGGVNSVSAAIEAQIAAVATVKRVSGADRYQGSVAVNDEAFPNGFGIAYLANGASFPDALTGGARAGSFRDRPLYLVRQDCVPQDVLDRLVAARVRTVVLLGGLSTLNGDVAGLKPC